MSAARDRWGGDPREMPRRADTRRACTMWPRVVQTQPFRGAAQLEKLGAAALAPMWTLALHDCGAHIVDGKRRIGGRVP